MIKCPICGGKKKKGNTTYSVDFETGVVVVRRVPCLVCVQCGKEWIKPDVAKELERIVEEARAKKYQTEIVSFAELETAPT